MEQTDPEVPLFADETVSDLLRQGLRLIQPQHGFRFGEDTVLLADYAAGQLQGLTGRPLRIADLGAGSGAATLLLAARLPKASFLAVELDPHSASALRRNVQINRLSDRVTPLCADYSGWDSASPAMLPPGSPAAGCFDLVIANPPYALPAARLNPRQAYARAESTMSLFRLIAAARHLLRPRGRLVLVHRCLRLVDVLNACRVGSIEPKRLRLVASLPGRPPARFLLAAVCGARPGSLVVDSTLLIRDSGHELTDEVRRIYGNESPMAPASLMEGLVRLETAWPGREEDMNGKAF